jgi:hypothetical protein
MSLKTAIIVGVVFVLLFVVGLGSAACGDETASSDVGWVEDLGSIFGSPNLKTSELELVAGPATCVLAPNEIQLPANTPCVFGLKSNVWRDRTMVVRRPIPANAAVRLIVAPVPDEDRSAVSATADDIFPAGLPLDFEVLIERNRRFLIGKEPSEFIVTCSVACRLPLQ